MKRKSKLREETDSKGRNRSYIRLKRHIKLVIWDSNNTNRSQNREEEEANQTDIRNMGLRRFIGILIIKIFIIILREKDEKCRRETNLRKSEKVEDQ